MDARRFKPTPVPRERRHKRLTRLTLADAHGHPIDIMVRDFSLHGLSAVAVGNPPALNAIVRVRCEDGHELWGLVRWTDGTLFGVEFAARPD